MLAVGLGGVPQVPSYLFPLQSPLGHGSSVLGGAVVVVVGAGAGGFVVVVDAVGLLVVVVVALAGVVVLLEAVVVVARVVDVLAADGAFVVDAGAGADGAADAVGVGVTVGVGVASLGVFTGDADVDAAAEAVIAGVEGLVLGPLWLAKAAAPMPPAVTRAAALSPAIRPARRRRFGCSPGSPGVVGSDCVVMIGDFLEGGGDKVLDDVGVVVAVTADLATTRHDGEPTRTLGGE